MRVARLKRIETVPAMGSPASEVTRRPASASSSSGGNWVSILPGLICVADRDGKTRHVSPLDDPPLYSEFVMIEPSRRPLSPQAGLFFQALNNEIERLSHSM